MNSSSSEIAESLQEIGIEDEFEEEEDEIQLTPAEVIQLMEEAWSNEKFAPEILPHKSEIVECLLGQIAYMEENLENLPSTDFKKSIHQMEVDRLRFLVTSYLRTRVEKIEIYVNHILQQELERSERNEDPYLTVKEKEFAGEYQSALKCHFDLLTPTTADITEKETLVKPNMHSFVFLKSKAEVQGIVIDEGNDDAGDEVDLNRGSQAIISYDSVSNLVKRGDVHLI